MKIIHLSDIHIRLQAYHEEYRECFENVYRDIENRKETENNVLIVITGDLFHNKVELTAECITLAIDFLSGLSRRFPTFLIAGNHDALLNNPDRMDTLSGIFYQRHLPHFYYLKYTGMYHIDLYSDEPITFHVESLLGSMNNVETMEIGAGVRFETLPSVLGLDREWEKNRINIGLYHGGVGKYKCQNNFEMEGEKSLEEFRRFDMTMLGDIHIPQFLDKEKRIAYAGSLISQNCGEGGYEHGYLVWDTMTTSATFQRVVNHKAYISIYIREDKGELVLYHPEGERVWKDNGEEEMSEFWENVPKWARVTLYGTEKESFEKAEYWLEKATMKTHTFTSLKRHYVNKSKGGLCFDLLDSKKSNGMGGMEGMVWTPKDVDEFLNSQSVNYSDKIREVLTLPLRSLKETGRVDSWKILKVEGKHLFGYGDFLLDLEMWSPPTVVGIFGKNSFGKSTIIDILTLLLYSRITRFSHGNSVPLDVIHRLEKKAEGKIWLEVDSERIMIHKKFSRTANDKVKTVQEIWKFPKNQKKGENGENGVRITLEDRKKMDKWVEMHLGSYEHFLNLCIQSQQYRTGFREMTQKDRKEYLFHHLHLNMYESMREEYHDKSKELTVIKNEMGKHPDWPKYNIAKEEEEYRVWKEKKEVLRKNIEEINQQLETTEKEMAMLTGSGSYAMDIILQHQTKFQKRHNELKRIATEEMEMDVSELIINIKGKENDLRQRQETMHNEYELKIEQEQEKLLELKIGQPPLPLFPTVPEMMKRVGNGCHHKEWLPNTENKDNTSAHTLFVCEANRSRMMWEEFHQWDREKKEFDQLKMERFMEMKSGIRYLSSTSLYKNWSVQQISDYRKESDHYLTNIFPKLQEQGERMESWWIIWKEKEVTMYPRWKLLWKTYHELSQQLENDGWTMKNLEKEKDRLVKTRFNKNCEICMNNPVHKRLEEIEEEINRVETEKSVVEQKKKDCVRDITNIYQEMSKYEITCDEITCDDITCGELKEIKNGMLCNDRWWNETSQQLDEKTKEWKRTCEKEKERGRVLEELAIVEVNGKINQRLRDIEEETFYNIEHWKELNHSLKRVETNDILVQMEQYWWEWKEYEKKMEMYQREIGSYRKRITAKEKELKRWKLEQEWYDVLYSIVLWKKIEEREYQRNELLFKVKLLREERDALQKSFYEAHYIVEKKEEQQEKFQTWKQRLSEIETELENTNQLVPLLSRNGLPLFLLSRVLPRFEKEWNRLLTPFLAGSSIHVVMENQDIDFYVSKSDGTISSRFFGGMEGFMLDVGCKMVIHQLSYEPKPPLFMIDEGISVLDKEHMENLPVFLDFLQSMFSHIFVISHIPVVRDYVHKSLYVEKKDGYSCLVNN